MSRRVQTQRPESVRNIAIFWTFSGHTDIFRMFLPGSVHDAQVYANSDFFLNKAKYIEGDDYVLGDSAYPISSFLITPFKNPFNYRQRQFNFIHSKHRVVVEHAFGRLKARFKALKELSVKDIKTAIKLADCAILLHNFLEICGEIWEINDQE
ncbi:putative nuclease HARBI1 [Rhizophagus irregularis DAOM 181602=DAOM 197198]|nr:putative nuclease HARBI1 [Rhizophagus irregularis DAOM 181602=DAOM 197198]